MSNSGTAPATSQPSSVYLAEPSLGRKPDELASSRWDSPVPGERRAVAACAFGPPARARRRSLPIQREPQGAASSRQAALACGLTSWASCALALVVVCAVAGHPRHCQADEVALPASGSDNVVVLQGATVHPVTGPKIPNGLIVMRDGRIDFVGPADELPESESAIDCRGKHIYPGLIDADTAMGLVEIDAVRATVDTSETGSSNPNVKAVVAFNPDSELIPVARVMGFCWPTRCPQGV